ncbi:MAG: agmatinase family protein [Planctomycetes bacterium]|nr:agmatinase family protein [Planctomycetota bacterium]
MTDRFDPDAAAQPGSGLFGLPHDPVAAGVRLLGVPFDATTSYRKGTALGPAAILAASHQVDLYDPWQTTWPGADGRPWRAGLSLEIDDEIARWNAEASPLAQAIIDRGGELGGDAQLARGLARVDELGERVNQRVLEWTGDVLDEGRLPGIVGGDHASPFGAIQAAALRKPGLGVLHFDAHADLRDAYEGFRWSHASIFHNVLEHLPAVARVLSVGLRDVGEREAARLADPASRVRAVYDHEWAAWRARGADLAARARELVAELPDAVWISFDIDGLEPGLCPNTGTPVPGGLRWEEAMLWLDALAHSNKRVVGFDLCEVSPGEGADPEVDSWDAMVGARLLYRLAGLALARRG